VLVVDQIHALPAHGRGRHRAVHRRLGADGWQDMLRQTARGTECGKRGVALQHGNDTGWAPMPIRQLAPVPRLIT
jgi:hypothetical protein